MRVGLSLPVQGSSNLSKEAIVSSLQDHSDACDVHFQITYRIRLTGRGSNTMIVPINHLFSSTSIRDKRQTDLTLLMHVQL